MKLFKYCIFIIIQFSCNEQDTNLLPHRNERVDIVSNADTIPIILNNDKPEDLNITTVSKNDLVSFSKTLIGIPYKYASNDPAQGFDCSGFISYVFNHFNITVPRSSVDFTNVGRPINITDAQVGDLILFTGTNDSIKIVGHMGIVTEYTDTLKFIHSTSGRANAVTISNLTEHYKKRFVKVIRVFAE